MSTPTNDHFTSLENQLRGYGKLAICLSGGADSCILLALAAHVLGAENVLGLTVETAFQPQQEANGSAEICRLTGVRHEILHPTLPDEVLSASVGRYYQFKTFLFGIMRERAASLGFEHLADATHTGDNVETRPAMRAVSEQHIVSPWLLAGCNKEDIRAIGHELGLPESIYNAKGNSSLLSRFAFGVPATEEAVKMISEMESFYRAIGFPECRVRISALNTVHIEVPATDIERLAQLNPSIAIKIREPYGNADY